MVLRQCSGINCKHVMYIPGHRLYARYLPVGGQFVDKWCISDGLDNGPVANVNVASLIRKGTKIFGAMHDCG